MHQLFAALDTSRHERGAADPDFFRYLLCWIYELTASNIASQNYKNSVFFIHFLHWYLVFEWAFFRCLPKLDLHLNDLLQYLHWYAVSLWAILCWFNGVFDLNVSSYNWHWNGLAFVWTVSEWFCKRDWEKYLHSNASLVWTFACTFR